MKAGKLILHIGLIAIIIVLGILVYRSIVTPMRFEDECNRRRDACAEKLKVIRTLQEAHKMAYGVYAANLDSLIIDLQQGKQPVVKKEIHGARQYTTNNNGKEPGFGVRNEKRPEMTNEMKALIAVGAVILVAATVIIVAK